MKLRLVSLLALTLVIATTAQANAQRSITTVFDLHYAGARIGEVRELFVSEGGRYRIESLARAIGPLALFIKGPLELNSNGQVTEEGLRPEQFSQRRGNDNARKMEAEFRWDEGVLLLKRHGKVESTELPPRSIDRLSLMYQFTIMPPETQANRPFFMTSGKSLNKYTFRIVGEEKLRTPMGVLNTIHIAKGSGGDAQYDVWVDKDRYYLPVRVVVTDEGRTVEQVVRSIKIN